MTEIQVRCSWASLGDPQPRDEEAFGRTVAGELVGEFLAVTPTPNDMELPWTVTHVPTGYRIAQAWTAESAHRLAEALAACGVDWAQVGTDAAQNGRLPGFRRAVALAWAHYKEQG